MSNGNNWSRRRPGYTIRLPNGRLSQIRQRSQARKFMLERCLRSVLKRAVNSPKVINLGSLKGELFSRVIM